MIRVCVAEDMQIIREGLAFILRDRFARNMSVVTMENGRQCLDYVVENGADLVITDIRMPEMDGVSLMRLLRERVPEIRVIVLSGYDDFDYCQQALRLGALDYLLKPVDEEQLVGAVRRAVEGLADAAQAPAPQEKCRPENISRILEYIKRNYARNISLAELAEVFHYNAGYFSQMFKRETGMNYLDYLNGVRVERARQILLEEDLKIEEVARRVGYCDAKYFSRMFRNIVGVTPSEYKKQQNYTNGKQ